MSNHDGATNAVEANLTFDLSWASLSICVLECGRNGACYKATMLGWRGDCPRSVSFLHYLLEFTTLFRSESGTVSHFRTERETSLETP